MDKPVMAIKKIKIEHDNCKICVNLEKEKNIKKDRETISVLFYVFRGYALPFFFKTAKVTGSPTQNAIQR